MSHGQTTVFTLSCLGAMVPPWLKSKRSLSGSTMEPFWSMWSPRCCFSARFNTCVKVWFGTMRARRC